MKYILLFALLLTISCDNASTIWKFLVDYVTKEGAAGIMGNLYAESGLKSEIYETSKHKKIGLSNEQYVKKVNDGSYSKDKFKGTYSAKSFIHDSVGFGLAQWTYYSRKSALYDKCKGKIGNLNCQLQYLIKEFKTDFSKLFSFLKTSHDVKQCSTKVLKEFERPANADSKVNERYQYSLKYYNQFQK